MGALDTSQKMLEDHPDVFADIVNSLLFEGKQVVSAGDLDPAKTQTVIKRPSGQLTETSRDIAKYWKNGNTTIALLNIENQSSIDPDMVLRVIAYEGVGYQDQVIKHRGERREHMPLSPAYPVCALVLYFGDKPWNEPITLKEYLEKYGKEIPAELKPLIQDYKMRLYQVAFMKPETVALFRSDFSVIAEYISQKGNPNYIPSRLPLKHTEETLHLLAVLTGDSTFVDEQLYSRFIELEGDEQTVCKYIEMVKNQGRTGAFDDLIATRLSQKDTIQKIVDFMAPHVTEADVRRVATERNIPIPTAQ